MKLYTGELDKIIEVKIKPNLKLIYELKIKGLKDKHIATALGITTKYFLEAMEVMPELKDTYDDAVLLLCSRLREVAIDRALGLDGKTDKDGELVGPDANLAVRLLEKLDPAFQKKQESVVTVTVEHVIHEISEKRRIEAEKRARIAKKHEMGEVV